LGAVFLWVVAHRVASGQGGRDRLEETGQLERGMEWWSIVCILAMGVQRNTHHQLSRRGSSGTCSRLFGIFGSARVHLSSASFDTGIYFASAIVAHTGPGETGSGTLDEMDLGQMEVLEDTGTALSVELFCLGLRLGGDL